MLGAGVRQGAATVVRPRRGRCWRALWAAAGAALLTACGTVPNAPPPATPVPRPAPDAGSAARGDVAGRHERLLVYVPAAGDALPAIAARFLGSADLAWRIADANGQRWQVAAGEPLVVPLADPDPAGVTADGYQTVPILCYHRFGGGTSKMILSPANFEAQLDWLARNHYRVLRLSELAGFLAGRQAVPQRSVVITIDDGYETVYRHAFPALKKYGFPATLFVYSDFIGSRDGLSWAQLQEMAASGLVDIQAHSKSHRNLVERGASETDASYRQSIESEVRQPRVVLERGLAAVGVRVNHFAYPFGDANELVLDAMRRNDYQLGVTVNPGGNPFFAHPMMLRRTMIFGDYDLDDFKARLQTRKTAARP
jgi:peptidoglycan/xylan/chitin deacetylase (PgdA/CDA1 family)